MNTIRSCVKIFLVIPMVLCVSRAYCVEGNLSLVRNAPALELSKYFKPVKEYGITMTNVIEFSSHVYTLKTVTARKLLNKSKASVLEIYNAVPEAVAAINGSFHAPGVPEEIFAEDGEVSRYRERQHKVFYVTKDGEMKIKWLKRRKGVDASDVVTRADMDEMESAVSGFHTGTKKDRTARTSLCFMADDTIKLIVSYPIVTLGVAMKYLRDHEKCIDWVQLDGGGSSQMIYDHDKQFMMGLERTHNDPKTDERVVCMKERTMYPKSCWRPVTDALVVIPK
ncbi:phosphodiester glycosidase family protein [Elusimicrobiota bacterium]